MSTRPTIDQINRENKKRGKMPRTRLQRVGPTLLAMALSNCSWATVVAPRTLKIKTADCGLAVRMNSTRIRGYFRQLEDMGLVEEVRVHFGYLLVILKDSPNLKAIAGGIPA